MASAALALLLTGCAGASDRYPSLATRDIERVSGTFEPVAASDAQLTPALAPANQAEQLQSLVAQAATAHAAFMTAVPGTRAAIARIGAKEPGDKSWTDAQIALAELDSQRSRAAIALGDLDLLYANASVDFVEREAIAEARANVLASVHQEDAILIELRGLADR
ncbi:hypothetical protein [Altererythrobacter lutimaris]|uniref:Uncharacterized protein n=1 Tax=Altererythrobacter lutimaris TaxID=2743979 RepID=A0A850H9V3_9SPHN|nr:hypothetical protein [Altererythrobacter lutimaris]NVE94509.1 hypothetical protein [Altererythrobacter lutimaris]